MAPFDLDFRQAASDGADRTRARTGWRPPPTRSAGADRRYPTVKVQSAEKACYSSLRQAFPNAFGTDLNPGQLAERRQQGVLFADCMRTHGINYPDPTTATANPAAAASQITSLDTSSPAFKAAGKTCEAEALKASG